MGKVRKAYFLLIALGSCVGTDFEPPIEPVLRFTVTTSDLVVSETFQMEAEYYDHRGIRIDTSYQWSSNDPTIASVDNLGRVAALAEGIVTITVSHLSTQVSEQIIVTPSQESVEIIQHSDTLAVGQSSRFRAQYVDIRGNSEVNSNDVVWSTNQPNVVNVSTNGTIRGMNAGTAMIYCRGISQIDSVRVRVIPNTEILVRTIDITSSVEELEEDAQFLFRATVFDENGQIVEGDSPSWSSTNENVAIVNPQGLVRALSVGTTQITARLEDLEASMELRVIEIDDSSGNNLTTQRSGTLAGRGGYDISGEFTLTSNPDGSLVLTLMNTSIDPSAPGPYYYLSNQERNVTGGLNLGKADNSITTINVTDDFPAAKLTDYDFLIVWCDPFNVTLGSGQFED